MTTPKAIATLNWSLDADCPHCNESVDLVDYDNKNDWGISAKIFKNQWNSLMGHVIICPHCNKEFELEKVEH